MTRDQYKDAETNLIARMQVMMERESGCLVVLDASSGSDEDSACFDDPIVRSMSTEREKSWEEFHKFCNLCKMHRHRPNAYQGTTLKLGPCDMRYPITMGKSRQGGETYEPTHHLFLATWLIIFWKTDGLTFLDLWNYRKIASQHYSD
jgi:hypothetical protein